MIRLLSSVGKTYLIALCGDSHYLGSDYTWRVDGDIRAQKTRAALMGKRRGVTEVYGLGETQYSQRVCEMEPDDFVAHIRRIGTLLWSKGIAVESCGDAGTKHEEGVCRNCGSTSLVVFGDFDVDEDGEDCRIWTCDDCGLTDRDRSSIYYGHTVRNNRTKKKYVVQNYLNNEAELVLVPVEDAYKTETWKSIRPELLRTRYTIVESSAKTPIKSSGVKHEEGICPKCGSMSLDFGTCEVNDGEYCCAWTCDDCGTDGTEVYSMEFIGHIID